MKKEHQCNAIVVIIVIISHSTIHASSPALSTATPISLPLHFTYLTISPLSPPFPSFFLTLIFVCTPFAMTARYIYILCVCVYRPCGDKDHGKCMLPPTHGCESMAEIQRCRSRQDAAPRVHVVAPLQHHANQRHQRCAAGCRNTLQRQWLWGHEGVSEPIPSPALSARPHPYTEAIVPFI